MTTRIRTPSRDLNSLKIIARLPLKCKKRAILIRNLDSRVIRKLSEVARHIIQGKIKLRPNQLRKLKRHKKILNKFKIKALGLKKKKTLIQRGGFLTPLLSVAIPALAGLLNIK